MNKIKKDEITIYTDGSCLGNPGPGGYAAVLMYGSKRKEISEGFRLTTNNRMEIMAVIEALKVINQNKKYDISVYTDSNLVVSAVNNSWIKSWEKSGWKKSNKKPVLNKDLWKELSEMIGRHNVKFYWVKSHIGIAENERCDILGKAAASREDLLDDIEYIKNKEASE